MCYAHGSLDQATGVCPMCKVFKPIGAARCPHIKGICRNRTLHPRHDVVYLKNAEGELAGRIGATVNLSDSTVQTFTGCGFCKWAATNPPLKLSGYQNPGWPGCCRPPRQDEHRFIGAADWPTVSVVHHVPIPADIKALLDSVTSKGGAVSPVGSIRIPNPPSLAPSMSRRASYQVASPTRTDNTFARTAAMPIPTTRGRPGGSPQEGTIPLTGNSTRNTSANGDGTASSLPSRSAMDQYQPPRRANDQHGDRRSESTNASQHSPGHRNVDLGGSLSRRNTERRPSISAATPSMSVSKVTVDVPPRRRTQNSSQNSPPPREVAVRTTDRQNTAPPALQRRGSTLEKSLASMSISSASSSSSGSNSETTVISDGGFTDYLSDESEAELQRQAEVKAALLAQNHLEEQEFKAARQQLASVDLRPPKSWNATGNSTPRSQMPTSHPTYAQPSTYVNAPYSSGSASVAGSTPSKG